MEAHSLKNSIGFLLGHACREVKNAIDSSFSINGIDITSEQWQILMSLWAKDGRGQNELISAVIKEKTTVTRLIDGLEKRNLVYRIRDKHDKRKKYIYLTDEGKALRGRVMPLAVTAMDNAVSGFSTDEIASLKSMLTRVLDNIAKT